MPRGRRRRRDTNRNASSGRATTSVLGELSRSPSTHDSLRRSLRLAVQTTRPSASSAADAQMTDVARRSQVARVLGGHAVEADVARDRLRQRSRRLRTVEESGSPRSGRRRGSTLSSRHQNTTRLHAAEAQAGFYVMQITTQPPHQAHSGAVLDPGLTVRIGLSPAALDVDDDLDNTTRLWAVASLVPDDEPVLRASIAAGTLTGPLFSSVLPFSTRNCGPDIAGIINLGDVSFPRLVIGSEGRYRIRVTLTRMRGAGTLAVQTVESEPITVEQATERTTPVSRL